MTYPERSHRRSSKVAALPITILAGLFILIGVVLLAGGIWLILLDGSWYYALAGLGLCITGVTLNMRLMSAVYVYGVVWIGTLIWALYEVGLDGWAQVPRLVAPTVLLVAILLTIPALRYTRAR
jgi:glucose dehydrogenase